MPTLHLISPAFAALLQVILIDIVLAGDNAVVIGIAAARVPKPLRRKVIFWGLTAAVLLRIGLAAMAATILHVIGLTFAGGILLLWVAWRLYRDLREPHEELVGTRTIGASIGKPCAAEQTPEVRADARVVDRTIMRIAIADLSMSLDNVLAVAGAAMNHVWVLTVGLVLSVALMGFASAMIANLLHRHPWISYAGLMIVVYVAVHMIWYGAFAIMHAA